MPDPEATEVSKRVTSQEVLEARHIVARRAIWHELLRVSESGELWEAFPEIGEHDWNKVSDRIDAIGRLGNPSDEVFDAAYQLLAERADPNAC